jgi:L-threonylcarbamoyladenylate synthase
LRTFNLRLAARCIRRGGIVAYPTEAVYGLGCDPLNAAAVLRLLTIKGRTMDKGVILIAANFAQIQPFISPLTAEQKQQLDNTWPGPTTWLLPANPAVPKWICGEHNRPQGNRIALRITAHPLAKALCETTGHAIVSTSANVSSQPPAKSALTVRRYFGDQLDFILTGALGGLSKPTTIKDLITGKTTR